MESCGHCYSPATCKHQNRCYRNMPMDPPSWKVAETTYMELPGSTEGYPPTKGLEVTVDAGQDWTVAFQDAPDDERKSAPIDAIFKFWPDAMLELSKHIWEGNKKYNPDHPKISWRRELSPDHVGSMFRHIGYDYIKAKTVDTKIKVMRAVAWRALAQLQILCEERNG